MKSNILFFVLGIMTATIGVAAAANVLGSSDLSFRIVAPTATSTPNLTITPASKTIDMPPPGATPGVAVEELLVTNHGDTDVTVRVENEVLSAKAPSARSWSIMSLPLELTVPANGTATIRVTVGSPHGGSPGDYLNVRVKLVQG